MLLGHIDVITAEKIAGWVVDSELPGRRVDISIFVDEYKIAQITCDRDRADLREKGHYGDGKHGFLYLFDPPLSTQVKRKVTVRHAYEGTQVSNGRCVLSGTGAEYTPASVSHRPEQSMRLPGPLNPRQLFEILALYDERYELYDLLTKIDFHVDSVRDVNFCAFGLFLAEPPEDTPPWHGNIRDLINGLILSERFQTDVIPTFLDAYREKRRLLFIHIPKCAGSDLSNHLTARYPSIGQRLSEKAWTSRTEFLSCLRDTVLRTKFSDYLFVRGHISLGYYSSRNLIRPGDRIFTILRNPVEIPISQINYIMTRFWRNMHRDEPDPDTRLWLEVLNMKSVPDDPDEQLTAELARKILRDQHLVPANPLCQWLGGGPAKAVIERLATHGVEVTDTTRYNAWLHEKWAIEANTRGNASKTFVSAASLSPDDMAYIRSLSEEDMELYQTVHHRLSQSGTSSLTGREIA